MVRNPGHKRSDNNLNTRSSQRPSSTLLPTTLVGSARTCCHFHIWLHPHYWLPRVHVRQLSSQGTTCFLSLYADDSSRSWPFYKCIELFIFRCRTMEILGEWSRFIFHKENKRHLQIVIIKYIHFSLNSNILNYKILVTVQINS